MLIIHSNFNPSSDRGQSMAYRVLLKDHHHSSKKSRFTIDASIRGNKAATIQRSHLTTSASRIQLGTWWICTMATSEILSISTSLRFQKTKDSNHSCKVVSWSRTHLSTIKISTLIMIINSNRQVFMCLQRSHLAPAPSNSKSRWLKVRTVK